VHNAGRSQIAAAFARKFADEDLTIYSAGTDPAEALNPAVLAAMTEVGVDLIGETPKRLSDEMARSSDVIVTMGCGDECPYYPAKRYEDWELRDPAGQSLEVVREIRDEIERRVRSLVEELRSLPT
jgi:arsenate reductase